MGPMNTKKIMPRYDVAGSFTGILLGVICMLLPSFSTDEVPLPISGCDGNDGD